MKKQNNTPQVNSELITRMRLASMLGMQYSGDRDLYKLYGYKRELGYADYWQQYKRQDMAKAIIDRPIKDCWRGPLILIESDDDKETQFEKQWKELEKRLKLRTKFIRLDKLVGLGRFGVLFFGLNDASQLEDLRRPVIKSSELLYVRPFGEDLVEIHSFVEDPRDERYGQPELYVIKLTLNGGDSTKVTPVFVHHSRLMHVVDGQLDSEILGTPRLEVVYNRLIDLEKLIGGSAEMFWKGARPGYQGVVDTENFSLGVQERERLEEQWEEYEHALRRLITAEGVELKALQSQIEDPSNHVDVQIMMISAETGIPKRVLTGSERGELASSQDTEHWNTFIQQRREEFAEQAIIRPFINKCVELSIIVAPDETFSVLWQDLFSVSDKDKAEVGKTRAQALREYLTNPNAEYVIPPAAFYELFLGLSQDEIDLIEEMRDALIKDESMIERIAQQQEEEQEDQEE